MSKDINRLYIHVPFCSSKCAYCSFYSLPEAPEKLVAAYFSRLGKEFSSVREKVSELHSIYIGGGTPTWLPSARLAELGKLLMTNFTISPDAEISMECNPESLDREKAGIIAGYVNRVSLGVQSFHGEFRSILGRTGNLGSIYQALDFLQKTGINNCGIDLIYGIPGQSISHWQKELTQAAGLPIQHLSAYALTFEEGSRLIEKSQIKPISEELSADLWEKTREYLASGGFKHYEISNYAKSDYECRHNLGIWLGDPYLGCGPAAASFDGTDRWTQVNDLNLWLAGKEAEIDRLSPEARAREIFAFGLRTSQGWDKNRFQAVTGFDWQCWRLELQTLFELDILAEKNNRVFCTSKGLLLWDEIAQGLI